MDIYAQEVNKMKSESTSAPVSKKRNFDATHFNAYGLPLACSSAFCGGYLGSGVSSHYAGPVTPFQEGQGSRG